MYLSKLPTWTKNESADDSAQRAVNIAIHISSVSTSSSSKKGDLHGAAQFGSPPKLTFNPYRRSDEVSSTCCR